MSTAAQRHGPRIGGWRTGTATRTPEPSIADLMSTLYRVQVFGPEGSSQVVMVMAFDEEQACELACLRLDAEGALAEAFPMGMPAEHHECAVAVLVAEVYEERVRRQARYAEMNEAGA